MERLVPKTLFGRLALLLLVALALSQLLSFQLFFEVLGPPHHPGNPPPFRGPPPHFHWPMLFDMSVRLAALTLAAWYAARWLSAPMLRMAQAAHDLGRNVMGPALPETGPVECEMTARVFNQMRSQIQQQLKDKDRFVAAVSHDLRTPLTRLALRAEAVPDPELKRQLRGDITEMNAMITATLDYLRGQAEPEPWVQMDLVSLLDSLAEDYQESGARVILLQDATTASETKRVILWTQVTALRRALSNLIDNAICYGDRAELQYKAEMGVVHICVRDFGPGIAESELENVLQPFYRLEASRNRNSGGVGLGLAIAKDTINQLGGTLTLQNAHGSGLLAQIDLPLRGKN